MRTERIKRFFFENGLSITVFGIFLISLAGQYVAGLHTYNDLLRAHQKAPIGYADYYRTGHFIEALFENWESEFLQMGVYVLFTAFLYQRGSAESKKLPWRKDAEPPEKPVPRTLKRRFYENSLTLALLGLFIVSFFLHAVGGVQEYNRAQAFHGEPPISLAEFFSTSEFWFESFQNWQSEFLSVGMLVVLSIFLRQKGSPESKPIDAPHDDEGG